MKHLNDCVMPEFYKQCHNWWIDVHSVEPKTVEMVINEIIWNNKYITVNRRPIFYRNWHKNGITRIQNLLDENNHFLSDSDIRKKYGVKCSFLDVLQIRQSIPIQWRGLIFNNENININQESEKVQILDKYVYLNKMKCKDLYWILVSNKIKQPRCIQKWTEFFPEFKTAHKTEWPAIFQMPFITTRDTRIQSLQYRLIHRIIPCNKWLFNIKIKDSSTCNFCDKEDNLIHYFIQCKNVKTFWSCFYNWWNRISEIIIEDVHEKHIIFGYPGNNDLVIVINYLIMLGKWFIYNIKLYEKNDIDFFEYLIQLKQRLSFEKIMCNKEENPSKFEKWNYIYDQL